MHEGYNRQFNLSFHVNNILELMVMHQTGVDSTLFFNGAILEKKLALKTGHCPSRELISSK